MWYYLADHSTPSTDNRFHVDFWVWISAEEAATQHVVRHDLLHHLYGWSLTLHGQTHVSPCLSMLFYPMAKYETVKGLLLSLGILFGLHMSCHVSVFVHVCACMCMWAHNTISALTIINDCLKGHTCSLATIMVFSRTTSWRIWIKFTTEN